MRNHRVGESVAGNGREGESAGARGVEGRDEEKNW